MTKKLTSEITSIEIDDATFKGTHKSIPLTYINYFFGNNGTGKSTIAKAIKSSNGITYKEGHEPSEYLTLLYDQDFIDANMKSYHSLPGVFTLNQENAEVQEKIDNKTDLQMAAQKLYDDAFLQLQSLKGEADKLDKQFQKDSWEKSEKLRTTFEKSQDGIKRSKQVFADAILQSEVKEHNEQDLNRMYNAVYSENAKYYLRFSELSENDITALDNVSGNEILSEAIVNTSNTPFAEFIKAIGSTDWVRQGHEAFHIKANGKCPYCSRKLDDDFEKQLADSFDDQYEINRKKLSDFLTSYRNTANRIFLYIQKIPAELYPEVKIDSYNDKLTTLKAVITENIGLINEKISMPSKIVTLNETTTLLKEISEIINIFNKMIQENNSLIDEKSKKKVECKKIICEQIAYVLKDVIENYDRDKKAISAKVKEQQDVIDAQGKIIKQLDDDILHLNSQTVETITAMKRINCMLHDAGFQGFELQPHPETIRDANGTTRTYTPVSPRNYDVIRTATGEVATNLSEGERNFIAFMYFQQMVFGSQSSEGETRKKIVVIDDPVSSLDSNILFIISTQINRMIEICRNNADNRQAIVPENFIKQIFILTHNAYFHRAITTKYANRYDFVSFYLVRKIDNKSSIKLCDQPDPNEPTERMNVNPVKNSYAALWDEYKELNSGTPLMSVIRRILEYYFLQLCGYDGMDLRKIILEDHKSEFTHDDQGNEDYTKYEMAASMLSYISANSSTLNDGMNYIDGCIDVQQCRHTFQMIFDVMGQSQHYDMMINIK